MPPLSSKPPAPSSRLNDATVNQPEKLPGQVDGLNGNTGGFDLHNKPSQKVDANTKSNYDGTGAKVDAPGAFEPGMFSITDWTGYPSGVARPKGPFRLLQGAKYDTARKAANRANAALRRADPTKYAGKHIHEIQPVKYGGSPTDPANKIALTPKEHAKYTTCWNRLQRKLEQ